MRDAPTIPSRRFGDRSRQPAGVRGMIATVATVAVLLLPRAAWTQPAPARPNAAMTAEKGQLPAAAPARPNMPGKMPIVLGWITFGVGALATVGGLQFMLINNVSCDGFDSASGNPALDDSCGASANSVLFTTTAATVALIGLGAAIYGHARRSNARYRQRSWDERFGGEPFAWAIGERVWASVTPTVTERRGLSATLHF